MSPTPRRALILASALVVLSSLSLVSAPPAPAPTLGPPIASAEPASSLEELSEVIAAAAPIAVEPPTTTPTTTVAPPQLPPKPLPAPPSTAVPATPSAPPSGAAGDPYDDASWDRLAQCESGGNWAINTGNGYYGGVQFSLSSWQSVGGTGYPHEHSRETQIALGKRLWEGFGWGAWPGCTSKFGWR